MKQPPAMALPDCTLPGRNTPADAREQQQRRIESETGQMVHFEIVGHFFIVMLKVWLEALINRSSCLDRPCPRCRPLHLRHWKSCWQEQDGNADVGDEQEPWLGTRLAARSAPRVSWSCR